MYVIMPRLSNLALVPVLALLSLVGCKKEDDLLSGPIINDCKRLYDENDQEMKAYRAAAFKDCAKANTLQEKMNSVGCEVKNTMSKCPYVSKAIREEEKAVLREMGAVK